MLFVRLVLVEGCLEWRCVCTLYALEGFVADLVIITYAVKGSNLLSEIFGGPSTIARLPVEENDLYALTIPIDGERSIFYKF